MKDVEWHHSAFQQHSVTRRVTLRYCGVLRMLHAVPQISSSVLRHNTALLPHCQHGIQEYVAVDLFSAPLKQPSRALVLLLCYAGSTHLSVHTMSHRQL